MAVTEVLKLVRAKGRDGTMLVCKKGGGHGVLEGQDHHAVVAMGEMSGVNIEYVDY